MFYFKTMCGMVGFVVVSIWICWGAFIMAMALKRAQENRKLNFWTKILAYPYIAIFLATDFLFNVSVGSLMFLKFPQNLLFTKRLNRYIKGTGWRKKMALGICQMLLDNFDPDGTHCNEKS